MIKSSKHLNLLLILCMTANCLLAQSWFQQYGIIDTAEWTETVVKAPDKGFFLVGKSEYPGPEGFYVYTDSLGNSIWERKLDDIELQLEDGWAFEDETFAVCGEAGLPSFGYLAKIDANGDTLWTEKYYDWDVFSRMTVSDDDFLVAGVDIGRVQYSRLDGNGGVIWHDSLALGVDNELFEIDTVRDASGDFMLFLTVAPFSGLPKGMSAIRLNASGDTLWTRHFWQNDLSEGSDAVLLSDSNFLIAGGTVVSGGDSWMHLVKMAPDGSTIWEKEYPGLTPSFSNYPISVDEANDGSLIVLLGTAGAGGDRYLIKLDANGDTLWTNYWSTASTFPNVVLANDNGHYNVAGRVQICYYAGGLCLFSDNAFLSETEMDGSLPDCVSECVWPGDANYDGIADNFDLLPIGIAYGETGPYRPGGIVWEAQTATSWPDTLMGGINYKHIDTDGNEIIDEADTLAIYVNYGLTHPLRPADEQGGADDPPLYLGVVPDSASAGDTVDLVVYLGSDSVVANNVYGIAFSILHDDFFVDTVVSVSYSACWIGGSADLLTLTYPSPGRVDIAITRTDGFEASGDGEIVRVKYVLDDDIGGRLTTSYLPAHFGLTKVRMIDALERERSVFTSGDSTIVGFEPTAVNPPVDQAEFSLFPNPTNGLVELQAGSAIESIRIWDALGRMVFMDEPGLGTIRLDLSGNEPGVYLVELKTNVGTSRRKLILH